MTVGGPPGPGDAMTAARRVLSEVFGFAAFRPGQERVIEALLAGGNALAVMPTGSGKSLCFQVPPMRIPPRHPPGARLRPCPAPLCLRNVRPGGRGLDSGCGAGHGYGMEDRGIFSGRGFWVLALLWLPVGVVAQALVRFAPGLVEAPGVGLSGLLMGAGSLVFVAPCGLPLALGCRRVWRLGYRRGAGWAWIGLGAVTVAASVVAGLLGPVAIALYAIVLSLPVWFAWWWLAHRG